VLIKHTIKQVKTKDYLPLSLNTRIGEAAIFFLEKGLQSTPVVDSQNKPVGIVSTKDFLKTFENGIDTNSSVSEILSKDFQTIQENEPLEKLFYYPIEFVLVINEAGYLTGVINKPFLKHILGENCLTYNPYFKAIFNKMSCGFLAVDANERVVFCNSYAEKVVGISNKEAMGRKPSEILDDDLPLRVLKTGRAEEDGGEKSIGGLTVACSAFPIINNGAIVGAIELFQDISDKKNLERELAKVKSLNKELEAIIDSSYDGITVTDNKGKMLRISKSYSRISGIPWEQLQKCIGHYVGHLDKSREVYLCDTPKDSLLVLSNQKSTTIKKWLSNSKELAITGNPVLNDDGDIERVVWNVRDISELNALKREIQENKYITARYYTELEQLRARLTETEGLVIHSPKMKKVVELAARVATVDTNVLITGETGVGKEVIAKIIHKASFGRDGPFILVNCGAIPENLLESELFGYESGSFTGAKKSGKIGLLEAANQGTILLDEIGDLPILLQVKILRVLQEQQIVRIGGTKEIKLDLRILAATNKNLKRMVKENKFREDLFYRLEVIPIHVPPLRERKEDIIPLAQSFLDKYSSKYGIDKEISQEVFEILESYSWPGNVRELENLIERVLIIGRDTKILPRHFQKYFESSGENNTTAIKVNNLLPLKDAKEMLERELLNQALSSGLSTRRAAKILKVDHSTIVRKINKYKDKKENPSDTEIIEENIL
jgi:PAS domain S-box-containing protein